MLLPLWFSGVTRNRVALLADLRAEACTARGRGMSGAPEGWGAPRSTTARNAVGAAAPFMKVRERAGNEARYKAASFSARARSAH